MIEEAPFSPLKDIVIESGWDWIFNMKAGIVENKSNEEENPWDEYFSEKKESKPKTVYGEQFKYVTQIQKIRFDILACEILAIGILAAFFVLIVHKIR